MHKPVGFYMKFSVIEREMLKQLAALDDGNESAMIRKFIREAYRKLIDSQSEPSVEQRKAA